ncbi:MAG: ribonuclease E activity regulator RraA [Chloroflexota bacterium]|nr:ribonuclease E activity regulator RraA [Chloroflexota bacterium]
MQAKTVDLCDQYADKLQVATPIFRDYGGKLAFCGPISTVQVHEDNVLVRAALEEPGNGRVLVVDGGGSLRCALVGDQLAALGLGNGWAGVVINGCIRDITALAGLPFGVKALATNPLRSAKRGMGARDIQVVFAGLTCTPEHYLYADEDGIIVAERPLEG